MNCEDRLIAALDLLGEAKAALAIFAAQLGLRPQLKVVVTGELSTLGHTNSLDLSPSRYLK